MGGPATVNPPAISSAPTTSSQPAGPSLKKQWDLTDPPPLDSGTNEKAKKFVGEFKAAMEPVKQCLLYTKVNAEKPKHDAMINKRDPLYAEFPSKLGEVNKDEKKADSVSKPFLDRARALSSEASKLKQDTEKSLKAWQAKEPAYIKSEQEIEELEKWDEKDFYKTLRKASDEIRSTTNENKYDEAVKRFEQLQVNLKPAYDEYQKQKEAKAKYETALKGLEQKLREASNNASPKLTLKKQEVMDTKTRMDSEAKSKDFVKALQSVGELGTKLDAFETARAALETKRKAYDDALAKLKPKLVEVEQVKREKLANLQQEIGKIKGEMEAAAKAEDFDVASKFVTDLSTKAESFKTAVAELDKQKQEYDKKFADIKPKLDPIAKAEKPDAAQQEVKTLQGQVEAAAKSEDYPQATKLLGDLKTKVEAAGKKKGKEFDIDVPGLPKAKAQLLGGKVEAEFALKIHVSGSVELDDTDKTNLDASQLSLKVSSFWIQKKAEPELKKAGLWDNFKVGRSGASYKATTSTTTSIGKIDLEVTFAGIDKKIEKDSVKVELKALEGKATLERCELILGDQEIEGLKFKGLKIGVGGECTISPKWTKIIGDMLKDQAKKTLEQVVEQAAITITGDVIIAGSFIVAGVATVGGSIYQIVQGFAIGDLAKSYGPHVAATKAGFKAGASGGGAPSDQFGKVGYDQGTQFYKTLFDKLKKENSEWPDDAIKKAIVAKADEALKLAEGPIEESVRSGIWDRYLSEHPTLLLGDNARWAYVACFGREPDSKNPDKHWKKYMTSHPTQSTFSPR